MTRLLSLALMQGLLLISSAATPGQENEKAASPRPLEPTANSQEAKKNQPVPGLDGLSGRRVRSVMRPEFKRVVLQLQDADCVEVANLVQESFMECTVLPVRRTNAIVFLGPEELVPQVREFLAQVDTPSGEGDGLEFAMIPVQQARVDEIADAVSSLLGGRGNRDRLSIAKDRGRSAIVIRGTKSATEKVREFVRQLDKPASSVSLEFAFFRANAGRTDGPVNVPTDLAPVAEELKRFGAVELAGRLTTMASENDKFSVEGAITETMPRVRVYGEVVSADSGGAVKLKVMAGLSMERPSRPDAGAEVKGQPTSRPARGAEFELETSVQTKRGDYVVLGSAPAGGAPGESVILVLHVRE